MGRPPKASTGKPRTRDITTLSCVTVCRDDVVTEEPLLHSPTDIKNVVGCLDSDAADVGMRWLDAYTPGKRCLAICGPSGVGKTTFARLLLGTLPSDTVEIDVGSFVFDVPNCRDTVCTVISEESGYADDKPLLLDNVESPAWTETSMISSFARNRCGPTVVVCDESRKARSRTCDLLHLRFPRVDVLVAYLCHRLNHIQPDAIADVVHRSACDVRQVQANLKSLRDNGGSWATRDVFMDGDAAARELFARSRTASVVDLWAFSGVGDSTALAFENYLSADDADISAVAKAADHMSLGDAIERVLYRSQAWQLRDFRVFCGALAPAHAVGPLATQIRPSTERGRMSRRRKRETKDNRVGVLLREMLKCATPSAIKNCDEVA